MSDVKWIKLNVNIFDDEKIKLIESMPEGDSLLIVWLKLLTLAGKKNENGYIFLDKDIPYTDEMLATIFRKSLNTIRLALRTFQEMDLIHIDEKDYIYISNWDKHQNIEGLEKIREQTRRRVAKYREKQKIESSNVTVTLRNAPDIDKEKEKKKKKKYKYNDNQMKLAKLLLREVKRVNPNAKDPKIEEWANDIRLMMERDNREGKLIQELILYSQSHKDFWYKVILSPKALRRNFDKLYLSYQSEKGEFNHEADKRPIRQEAQHDLKTRRDLW